MRKIIEEMLKNERNCFICFVHEGKINEAKLCTIASFNLNNILHQIEKEERRNSKEDTFNYELEEMLDIQRKYFRDCLAEHKVQEAKIYASVASNLNNMIQQAEKAKSEENNFNYELEEMKKSSIDTYISCIKAKDIEGAKTAFSAFKSIISMIDELNRHEN